MADTKENAVRRGRVGGNRMWRIESTRSRGAHFDRISKPLGVVAGFVARDALCGQNATMGL